MEKEIQNDGLYLGLSGVYSLEEASIISRIQPNDILLMYSFINTYQGRIPECIKGGVSGEKMLFTGDNVMLLQPCFEQFSEWLDKNYDEKGRLRYIDEEDLDNEISIEDFSETEEESSSEEKETNEQENLETEEDEEIFFDEDEEEEKPKKKKKKSTSDYYERLAENNKKIEEARRRLASEEQKKLEEERRLENERKLQQEIENREKENQRLQAEMVSGYYAAAAASTYTAEERDSLRKLSEEYRKNEEQRAKLQKEYDERKEELNRLRAEYGIKAEEERRIFEEEQHDIDIDARSFSEPKKEYTPEPSFKYDSEVHRGFDFTFNGQNYNAEEYIAKQEQMYENIERQSVNRAIVEEQTRRGESTPKYEPAKSYEDSSKPYDDTSKPYEHHDTYEPPKGPERTPYSEPVSSHYTEPVREPQEQTYKPQGSYSEQKSDFKPSYSEPQHPEDAQKYEPYESVRTTQTSDSHEPVEYRPSSEEYKYKPPITDDTFKTPYATEHKPEIIKENILGSIKAATYNSLFKTQKEFDDYKAIELEHISKLKECATQLEELSVKQNSIAMSYGDTAFKDNEFKESFIGEIKEKYAQTANYNVEILRDLKEKEDRLIIEEANFKLASAKEKFFTDLKTNADSQSNDDFKIKYENLNKMYSEKVDQIFSETKAQLSSSNRIVTSAQVTSSKLAIIATQRDELLNSISQKEQDSILKVTKEGLSFEETNEKIKKIHDEANAAKRETNIAFFVQEHKINSEINTATVYLSQKAIKEMSTTLNELNIPDELKVATLLDTVSKLENTALNEARENFTKLTVGQAELYRNIERLSGSVDEETRSQLKAVFTATSQVAAYRDYENNQKAILLTAHKEKVDIIKSLNIPADVKQNLIVDLKKDLVSQATEITKHTLNVERTAALKTLEANISLESLRKFGVNKVSNLDATERNLLNIKKDEINSFFDNRINELLSNYKAEVFAMIDGKNELFNFKDNDLPELILDKDNNFSMLSNQLILNNQMQVSGFGVMKLDRVASISAAQVKQAFIKDKEMLTAGTDYGTGAKEVKDFVTVAALPITAFAALSIGKYRKAHLAKMSDSHKFTLISAELKDAELKKVAEKISSKKLKPEQVKKIQEKALKKNVLSVNNRKEILNLIKKKGFTDAKGTPLDLAKLTKGQLRNLLNDKALNPMLREIVNWELLYRHTKLIKKGLSKASRYKTLGFNRLKYAVLSGTDFDDGFRFSQRIYSISTKALKASYRISRYVGGAIYKKYKDSRLSTFVNDKIADPAKELAKNTAKKVNQKVIDPLKDKARPVLNPIKNKATQKIKSIDKRIKTKSNKIFSRVKHSRPGKAATKAAGKVSKVASKAFGKASKAAKKLKNLKKSFDKFLAKIGSKLLQIFAYGILIIVALFLVYLLIYEAATVVSELLAVPGEFEFIDDADLNYFDSAVQKIHISADSWSMGEDTMEFLWYDTLNKAHENSDCTPEKVNGGTPPKGFADFSKLADFQNETITKIPESEIRSYGHRKTDGTLENVETLSFYNADGKAVAPNNSVELKYNDGQFAGEGLIYSSLATISNCKTILATADIKVQYGGNVETDGSADEDGLNWSKDKYVKYCERLFKDTHHVWMTLSSTWDCFTPCASATWYCDGKLPTTIEGESHVYEYSKGNSSITGFMPNDKFKCADGSEPNGYYFCNTKCYCYNNGSGYTFYKSDGSTTSEKEARTTDATSGTGSGCEQITVSGKTIKVCPGHPFKVNSKPANYTAIINKAGGIKSSEYSKLIKETPIGYNFANVYYKYKTKETTTTLDVAKSANSQFLALSDNSTTLTSSKIDMTENSTANDGLTSLARSLSLIAHPSFTLDFNSNGDKSKIKDVFKFCDDYLGDSNYSLGAYFAQGFGECWATGDNIYCRIIPYNYNSLQHKCSDGKFETCTHPYSFVKLLETPPIVPADYIFLAGKTVTIKIEYKYKLRTGARVTGTVTIINIPAHILIPDKCKGCEIDKVVEDFQQFGYYTFCEGHELTYCPGHRTLNVKAITKYVDDEVSNPTTLLKNFKDGKFTLENPETIGVTVGGEYLSPCLWDSFNINVESKYMNSSLLNINNQINWLDYTNTGPLQSFIYPETVKERAVKDKNWSDTYCSPTEPPNSHSTFDFNYYVSDEHIYSKVQPDGTLKQFTILELMNGDAGGLYFAAS